MNLLLLRDLSGEGLDSKRKHEGTPLERRRWGWFNIVPLYVQWTQQSSKVYKGRSFNSLYSFQNFLLCIAWVKKNNPLKMTSLMSKASSLFSKRKFLAPVALFSYFLKGKDIQGHTELLPCFLDFPSASRMPCHTHNFILLRSKTMSLPLNKSKMGCCIKINHQSATGDWSWTNVMWGRWWFCSHLEESIHKASPS